MISHAFQQTHLTENTALFLQEQTVFTIKADEHSPNFLVVQDIFFLIFIHSFMTVWRTYSFVRKKCYISPFPYKGKIFLTEI